MAATAQQLATLDNQHRIQQSANAEAVARILLAYWALVDGQDIAGTGTEWLNRATEAVVAGWHRSVNIGLAYATSVRRLQQPTAPSFQLPRIEIPPVGQRASVTAKPGLLMPNFEQISKSLTYTGLVTAATSLAKTPKAPAPTEEPDQARATERTLEARRERIMRDAAGKAAAAAVRHVQNGGREAVLDVVKRDPVAKGYVRITREDPCYFCAILASRGPVYQKDSFDESNSRFKGEAEHKVHDSCGCSLRPVYSRSMLEWPEPSLKFDELWRTATQGKSTKKAILAFRQAYEGRVPSEG